MRRMSVLYAWMRLPSGGVIREVDDVLRSQRLKQDLVGIGTFNLDL